jgi:hypothetical protein
VAFALGRINDMNGAVARGKALTDEGEQDLIELFFGVEKRARVATAPDLPTREIHCTVQCVHR